jgi:hypothetical protein
MRPNTAEDYYARVNRRGPDECWPWTGAVTSDGYGRFCYANGEAKASRFGWELANGPIPDGLNVLHSCDCPPCQNPAHWFLGTHQENMADRDRKGRTARGERSGARLHPEKWLVRPRGEECANAKLTNRQVAAIRRRYAKGGTTQDALAREHGVTQGHISELVRGLKRAYG